MAGGGSGAASGAILGIVAVILLQQFGYLDLSNAITGLVILIITILVLAIIFGILGRALKGRAIRKAGGVKEWTEPTEVSTPTTPESGTSAAAPPADETAAAPK